MYIHNYYITIESFLRFTCINDVLSKLTSVYKIPCYVGTFFSYVEYFVFCFLLITRHERYKKLKRTRSLNYRTTDRNYTYMTEFLKK